MKFLSLPQTKTALVLFASCAILACTQQPAHLEVKRGAAYQKKDFSLARDVNMITPYKINVTKGQTLYQVSREYEVPIRDLIEINELQPPYELLIGQQIKLPKPTYHLVRSGDTAYDIARGYNVSVAQLVQANNIPRPYTIKVGQRLKVPGQQTDMAATETAIDESETQSKLAYSRDVSQKPLVAPRSSAGSPSPVSKPSRSVATSSTSKNSSFVASNKKPIFNWPVQGRVISSFGPKKGGLQNDGINISANEGSPIYSAEDGVVVYAGNELKGYGNLLLIKHNGGYLSAYAHTRDMVVRKGDAVSKGQKIATVGSTGHVDTPQLHFSIRKGRTAVNPVSYLPSTISSR